MHTAMKDHFVSVVRVGPALDRCMTLRRFTALRHVLERMGTIVHARFRALVGQAFTRPGHRSSGEGMAGCGANGMVRY